MDYVNRPGDCVCAGVASFIRRRYLTIDRAQELQEGMLHFIGLL